MKEHDQEIETVLQVLESALPERAMEAFQDESLTTEQLREVLEAMPCQVDALTLIRTIQVLNELPDLYKSDEALERLLQKIHRVGSGVRASKNKDQAYRDAATQMNWRATDGGRKPSPEQDQILDEYLDLIGVAHLYSGNGLKDWFDSISKNPPEPMEKLQAIEFLAKKYNKLPTTVYKAIQRAKKKRKNLLKSEKIDFTYLNNTLPTYKAIEELQDNLTGTD
jgi:hypothetical protein